MLIMSGQGVTRFATLRWVMHRIERWRFSLELPIQEWEEKIGFRLRCKDDRRSDANELAIVP